jgi:hypothetical protein
MVAGLDLVVLELAGELLDDGRPETRAALARLLRPIGLRIALVVLAINASAPSYTSSGLRHIGASAREVLDLLTALRGRRCRIRVCATHLDERVDGFTELAELARANLQTDVVAAPAGAFAVGLRSILASLDPFLAPLLGTRALGNVARMAHNLSGDADPVWATLENCLTPLLGPRPGKHVPPPRLEGLVLAGFPPGGTDGMVGDPFAIDRSAVIEDLRVYERKRWVRASVLAAAASLVLAIPYARQMWHIGRTPAAVDDFVSLVGDSDTDRVDRAEQRAGRMLLNALVPSWPPLDLAYPSRKQRIQADRERFLGAVRERYLWPKLADPSASVRLYGMALLRATDRNDLGALALRQQAGFANRLGMPEVAVEHYVRLSSAKWTGAFPFATEQAVAVGPGTRPCHTLLREENLTGPDVDLETLVALQKCTRQAVPSSDAPAMDVLRGLALESPEDAQVFLAQTGPLELDPPATKSSLRSLVAAVEHANLRIPSPAGKSLREAIEDLAGMPCATREAHEASGMLPVEDVSPAPPDPLTIIAASRSSYYLNAFVNDLSRRKKPHALLFADREFDAVGAHDMPGRGAQVPLPGRYTAAVVESEVAVPMVRLAQSMDGACVPRDQQASFSKLVRKEIEAYAAAYKAELHAYLASFTFASDSLASLQKDLQDMVVAGSWFDVFWSTVAQNAAVETHNDATLAILSRELADLASVAALVPGKGKPIKLDKYYEIFKDLPATLEQTGLAAVAGKLGDRLDPLGKLGLKLLDPEGPQPLPKVRKWLAAASLTQDLVARPFLLPAKAVYDWAIADVSHAIGAIYAEEMLPVVEPLWQQFPFAPYATADADPADLAHVLGPNGSLRAVFRDGVQPVLTKRPGGDYEAKSAADFGAVRVAKDILALGRWLDDVNGFLFDEAGKPKPISLSVQPGLLAKVEPRSTRALSRSYLAIGDMRVEGFNQAPARKLLPVSWIDSPTAFVGVEITDPATGTVFEDRRAGAGEAWPFFRLLYDASRPQPDTYEWEIAGPVRFQIRPDPWDRLLPPDGRFRMRTARSQSLPSERREQLEAWMAP